MTPRSPSEPRFDGRKNQALGTASDGSTSADIVICVHASTNSGDQWRKLRDTLSGTFTVVTPDLYGYGASPPWPGGSPLRADDEVELIAPLIRQVDAPVHLVGHGFGGLVALKLALRFGARIASLSVYEPIVFSALTRGDADHPACEEALRIRRDVVSAFDRGEPESAARAYIEYWAGTGSWERLSLPRRRSLVLNMPTVRSEWDTLYTERTPLSAYRAMTLPIYYMTGSATRVTVARVAELMASHLQNVTFECLPGLNHLGPTSHPDIVNHRIKGFLERVRTADRPARPPA